MSGADGFEQRQAEEAEHAERTYEQIEIDESEADMEAEEALYDAAFIEREKREEYARDVGYHTNDFGEVIPHAVTVWPVKS